MPNITKSEKEKHGIYNQEKHPDPEYVNSGIAMKMFGLTRFSFNQFIKVHKITRYNPINPGIVGQKQLYLYSVAQIRQAIENSKIE